jgi:hypothetical protein
MARRRDGHLRVACLEGTSRRTREGEPFSQRFAGTFSEDGNTITGRWEVAEDGTNYETDFDLVFRRVGT